MEKCKIFTCSNINYELIGLQDHVNDWLAAHKELEIIKRKVATCIGTSKHGDPLVSCTIVIFYRAA